MTGRRPILLDVRLPDLSPTQANFLWDVLTDLTTALWDAYEDDLLNEEMLRQHLLDMEAHQPDVFECDIPSSPLSITQEPNPNP